MVCDKLSHIVSAIFESYITAFGKVCLMRVSTAIVGMLAGLAAIAVAAAANPIRIGISLGLTGKYERPARMQQQAYIQWRDELNASGGLFGRPIEMSIRDDRSNPEIAVDIYRGFVQGGQQDLIIGPYSSGITAAVAPIADGAGVPMLAAGAAADSIWKQGYGNVFGMWTPASRYALGILQLAYREGLRSVAILHADDAFSKSIAAGARRWAPYLNLNLIADIEIRKGWGDIAEPVERVRDAAADLVIVAGHFDDAVQAQVAFGTSGWLPQAFFATVGPALPAWRSATGAVGELAFATSIWEPQVAYPGAREFAEAFQKRYGVEPSYHAATAYAAGKILEAAAGLAGSLDRDGMRAALLALDTSTVIGRYTVDRTGMQTKRVPLIVQWQYGRKEIVWPDRYRTRPPIFSGASR